MSPEKALWAVGIGEAESFMECVGIPGKVRSEAVIWLVTRG